MMDQDAQRVLADISVALPSNRVMTLLEILTGWRQHIQRLRAELSPDFVEDSNSWGAHDYLAALHLRGLVALGISQAPSGARNVAQAMATDADEEFKSFTEPDVGGMVNRFSGERHEDDEWWWNRVPVSGPVRYELEHFVA